MQIGYTCVVLKKVLDFLIGHNLHTEIFNMYIRLGNLLQAVCFFNRHNPHSK